MTYTLGKRSRDNLAGVHPDLVKVIERALQLTAQDFGIAGKAVRTAEEQHALFLKGVSQKDGYKHKSNHQPWADGYGHAVDLTPFINGSFDVNNEAAQYPIAAAMSQAAKELGIKISWGGNWMEPLQGQNVAAMKDMVTRYKINHPGPDFIDLPHFQLS
jgi:peptidoglycan L-alanyl-D-glutamate endopeptidase CwlK